MAVVVPQSALKRQLRRRCLTAYEHGAILGSFVCQVSQVEEVRIEPHRP